MSLTRLLCFQSQSGPFVLVTNKIEMFIFIGKYNIYIFLNICFIFFGLIHTLRINIAKLQFAVI